MSVSAITSMELFYGAEYSMNPEQNLQVVEGFLARLEVLEYDMLAATHTGQLRTDLRKAGTPIGPYDGLIAGHARSLGLILITNNIKEFKRVEGLRIEDWAEPAG
jgi:tRNA(fMet)-specific endonuclease VapC